MVSEFPYGYLESVSGIGHKDCEQGIPERMIILVISGLHVET
jgi:hypothetical protein